MEIVVIWFVYVAIFLVLTFLSRAADKDSAPYGSTEIPRKTDWRQRFGRVTDPLELAHALASDHRSKKDAAAERLSVLVWKQLESGLLDSIPPDLREAVRQALPLHSDYPNLTTNILKLLGTAGDKEDLAIVDRMLRLGDLWKPVRTAAEQCREALRSRFEPELTLLRPSTAPREADTLLHPVGHRQIDHPELLLRSANPEDD